MAPASRRRGRRSRIGSAASRRHKKAPGAGLGDAPGAAELGWGSRAEPACIREVSGGVLAKDACGLGWVGLERFQSVLKSRQANGLASQCASSQFAPARASTLSGTD